MNPSTTAPPLTGPDEGRSSTSLWRHRDFRRYLTGRTAGVAGSSINSMAIPMLAVIELDATPGQVAWPAFWGQLPPALLALHAGALADRRAERRQMITGDLVSATALATVPVAAALDALTLAQLMVLAAVQGAAGGVHDAAAISLLPTLVDRSLIQRSNSRIGSLFAIAATGPDAGREHLADLRRPAAGRAARRRARHAGRRTRRAGRQCLPARRPPCGPGPFAAARPAADACPSAWHRRARTPPWVNRLPQPGRPYPRRGPRPPRRARWTEVCRDAAQHRWCGSGADRHRAPRTVHSNTFPRRAGSTIRGRTGGDGRPPRRGR